MANKKSFQFILFKTYLEYYKFECVYTWLTYWYMVSEFMWGGFRMESDRFNQFISKSDPDLLCIVNKSESGII